LAASVELYPHLLDLPAPPTTHVVHLTAAWQ